MSDRLPPIQTSPQVSLQERQVKEYVEMKEEPAQGESPQKDTNVEMKVISISQTESKDSKEETGLIHNPLGAITRNAAKIAPTELTDLASELNLFGRGKVGPTAVKLESRSQLRYDDSQSEADEAEVASTRKWANLGSAL